MLKLKNNDPTFTWMISMYFGNKFWTQSIGNLDCDIWNFPLLQNWEKIKTNKLSRCIISWLAGSPVTKSVQKTKIKTKMIRHFKFYIQIRNQKFSKQWITVIFLMKPWKDVRNQRIQLRTILKDDPREHWIQFSRQNER